MQLGRRLIIAAMLAVASSQAFAATKCQSGSKTLYTEAPACPAGYVNATPSLDGTLSTVRTSDTGHQQQDDAKSSPVAADTQVIAQEPAPAAGIPPPSKSLTCGAFADQIRALETEMQQRQSRQSLEALAQRYNSLRGQQTRNQC